MRYFLDTEFNGFGGALLSLALVPEYGDEEFYVSLPPPDKLNPWAEQHVMPYMRFVPVGLDYQLSREHASQHLEAYLAGDTDPIIVADWPDDLAHFCQLMLTGPGQMIDHTGLRLELINGAGFSAAANSKVPHNALHDARALRDFYQSHYIAH
ncbi:MAG: 3'-5' exoribonuclease [Sphingomonadales bacterium]|nr:3'-5' exoribonuclease [Sphingomonadales bacterium]